MRIAILTSYLSVQGGGLFTAVHSLARALLQHTHIDSRVFGLLDEGSSGDLKHWNNVEVSAFERGALGCFGVAPKMLEAIRSFRPDLIHIHGLWTVLSIVGLVAHRRFNIPRIVSPHGMLDSWALSQRSIKKVLGAMLFEKSNLQFARCVHATAMAELQAIRDFGLRNPVCLVPNAVEIPDQRSPSDQKELAQVHGGQKCILVYLGRLHPKKGLTDLLKGWAMVREQYRERSSHWQLRIAGFGDSAYESALRATVCQLGIGDSVELSGPKLGVEKSEFLTNADGLILPSRSEGLPMIVLEAWAHGLPTLVTRHCNVPEGVEAGASVEIGTNSESICKEIVSFFARNAQERRAMGIAARRLAETRFGTVPVALAMEEVYLWAVGGRTLPSSIFSN